MFKTKETKYFPKNDCYLLDRKNLKNFDSYNSDILQIWTWRRF